MRLKARLILALVAIAVGCAVAYFSETDEHALGKIVEAYRAGRYDQAVCVSHLDVGYSHFRLPLSDFRLRPTPP